jgi:putative membrane protein
MIEFSAGVCRDGLWQVPGPPRASGGREMEAGLMLTSQKPAFLAMGAAFTVVLAWSAVHPHDYFTWILEVFPALLALAVLALTYRRFQFTTFIYLLITVHACILFVGGHYTYAEVPFFNWLRDSFHLARNDYDRVGHFMQGFVPALVAREVLVRNRIVLKRGWLAYVVLSICMAISALYELLEWRVSVATGSAADSFLGTQGDPWDTQKDMAMALIGSASALLLFSRWHDRMIEKAESFR